MRWWLQRTRKMQKRTINDVANAVGISSNAYFMIEHGTRNPKVGTAKKIAEFLGFGWEQFYEDV